MIIIRTEQMQAFNANAISQFKSRLRGGLARSAPSQLDLDALIERGMVEAPGFGLTTEHDTARFIEITGLDLGGFPEGRLPVPALAILMSVGLAPEIKLARYQAWAHAASGQH